MTKLRSFQEVRDSFERNGLTVTGWAAEQGFRASDVYAVLSGRAKGRRGTAYQIAVALGIKAPPQGVLAGKVHEDGQ